MESLNNGRNLILTRPIVVNYCDEGSVNGQIVRVHVEERDSSYSDTGKRS